MRTKSFGSNASPWRCPASSKWELLKSSPRSLDKGKREEGREGREKGTHEESRLCAPEVHCPGSEQRCSPWAESTAAMALWENTVRNTQAEGTSLSLASRHLSQPRAPHLPCKPLPLSCVLDQRGSHWTLNSGCMSLHYLTYCWRCFWKPEVTGSP